MYHLEEETGDLVIDGWETGIASSPHKGIGNIQCGNIATETGEVMCNFSRVQQSQVNSSYTGNLWVDNQFGGTHLAYIGTDGYKYLCGAGANPY